MIDFQFTVACALLGSFLLPTAIVRAVRRHRQEPVNQIRGRQRRAVLSEVTSPMTQMAIELDVVLFPDAIDRTDTVWFSYTTSSTAFRRGADLSTIQAPQSVNPEKW